MDINSYAAGAAKYLDSNSKEHNLIDYVGALSVIDSRRKYIHDGKSFHSDFYDSIAANNVFTFWGKNTGTKNIHFDEIYFNPGLFLIEFSKDAAFTLGGNPYTLFADENPAHIGSTYNLVPAFNLHMGSSNINTFKIYAQPAGLVRTGGTIFAREYNQSPGDTDVQYIIAPGQSFTAQFKNVGTTSLQYFLRMLWHEVEI